MYWIHYSGRKYFWGQKAIDVLSLGENLVPEVKIDATPPELDKGSHSGQNIMLLASQVHLES